MSLKINMLFSSGNSPSSGNQIVFSHKTKQKTKQNKNKTKFFSHDFPRSLLPSVLLMLDTSALTNYRAEHVLRRLPVFT